MKQFKGELSGSSEVKFQIVQPKPNLGGCYYIIDYYSIIFNYHLIIQSSYSIIIQLSFSFNSIIFKGELSG